MDPARQARLRQLFDEAMQRPAELRTRFLDESTQDDPALRDEVLRYIHAARDAGSFIEQPAPVPPSVEVAPPSGESTGQPGQQAPAYYVGPYRILRELGRGGMGSVFLAVRADDTFRKLVALKVLRADPSNEEQMRRFRQERQVLAALDHPNIGRILDGGALSDGRPYYVMDYIEGQPIDQYANRGQLPVADRLRVFQQVCRAVHYLHENLMVHRDLKPANIMVTADGTAKLLDFGITKVQRLGEPGATMEMSGGPLMMMTPGYASPEQMKGETVTKASDIYSLGVILYEMLTGKLPFESNDDGRSKLMALLSGVEPPRPSTNLVVDVQRTRETTRQLKRRLAGDLDAIVMMALRAEPGQRYSTALEMAEDLQNFLDGRPIRARRETGARRAGKFVKRHPWAVAAVAALVALSGFGGWQMIEARIQRERAQTKEAEVTRLLMALTARLAGWHTGSAKPLSEEERAGDVVRLVRAFETDLPASLEVRPGMTPERRLLLTQTERYLETAEMMAGESVPVRRAIATAWHRVGDVQGSPKKQVTLGDREGAVRSYRHAASIYRVVTPAAPEAAQQLSEVQSSLNALGAPVQQAPPAVAVEQPAAPAPAAETPLAPLQTAPQSRPPATQAGRAPPVVAETPQTPPAAAPVTSAPPAAPVDNTDWGDLRDRLIRAQAQAVMAEAAAEPIRRNLQAQGMTLNPQTSADLTATKLYLDQAKADCARRDAAGCQTNIDKAEYKAKQVLRYFGR